MKKSYLPIKIEQLGNLAELTQGPLGGYGDGMSGMSPGIVMGMMG